MFRSGSTVTMPWFAALAQCLSALTLALAEDPITFNKHVAPILFHHCATCHRPGEVAPFPLLTYKDAAKRAAFLHEVTASRRMPPFSLMQLTSCGVTPAEFQILVAKGVNAPLAAYAPVCKTIIKVNTPGCTTADLLQLAYTHRRRPMFPWEPETEWSG